MKVLVACEFSGITRDAFAARGHEAVSCDILPTEQTGRHYQGDVRDILDYGWDLMVAHPPCTYLAASGARWWKDRQAEQAEALDFVRTLLDAPIPKIALENPVGKVSTAIRPASQYIQPWEFGHGESKRTGLWLKNLPLLEPTEIVDGRVERVYLAPDSRGRKRKRELSYPGIARAMAEQWG